MADRPQGTTQEPGRTPAADRPSDTREQVRDRGAQVQERAQEMGVHRFAIGLRRREARSKKGHKRPCSR